MKDLTPGMRYFKCDECKHEWGEWCRDASSPSGDICPECNEVNWPLTPNEADEIARKLL